MEPILGRNINFCMMKIMDQRFGAEAVTDKGKVYKFKTRLPKNGEFQFRYLVDDQQWVNDADADRYIANEFGEDNCLVSTVNA